MPCRTQNNCRNFDPNFGCTFMGEGAREIDPGVGRHVGVEDGLARIKEECKGCGRCASVCPSDAIRIKIDNPSYIDECVSRISGLVDVN